jgi:hypothetical protein
MQEHSPAAIHGGHCLAMSYYRPHKTGGRRQWVGRGAAVNQAHVASLQGK